jgi:hypothetical protein
MKQFGETVQGYSIPVLNEREIRGAAGILFLLTIIAFLKIIFGGDFIMFKYFILYFMLDMGIRIFINPKYSPTLTIARFFVRKQTPLYVGAAQKRFAWMIGLTLSSIMFVHIVIFNAFGPISGLTCFVCMIFMFFELAFNICIGCKIYGLFNKGKVLHCPGEVCELKDRQEIQKTKPVQWAVVAAMITLMISAGFLFHDQLTKKPKELGKRIQELRQ